MREPYSKSAPLLCLLVDTGAEQGPACSGAEQGPACSGKAAIQERGPAPKIAHRRQWLVELYKGQQKLRVGPKRRWELQLAGQLWQGKSNDHGIAFHDSFVRHAFPQNRPRAPRVLGRWGMLGRWMVMLPRASFTRPPFPPKQTSMRHDIEGMNLCSFALQELLAPSSVSGAQLLMSGRLAVTTAVFDLKSSCVGGTPVVPRRDLTIGRVSSAGFPLKFPQCPSWPGWACMVILMLM